MKDTELDVNNNSKPRSNKPLSAKDYVKLLFPNKTDEELDSLAAEIEQNHNVRISAMTTQAFRR